MNDDTEHYALSPEQLHAAQVRVLLQHSQTLAQQIAELTITQQQAAERLAKGDARMARLEAGLEENTAVTTQVRDLLTAFQGGFKVLGWLGTGLKFVGGLAVACTAIYTALYMATHGGQLPGDK